MAHIQSPYAKLWKPQNLSIDKISSQKMFIDNIDALEAFALSTLKKSKEPVLSIEALRAINTSDTTMYTDGMTIMVKSSGIYFFDRGNTEADNGNTIIAPTTGGGRWISDRIFLGEIALKDTITKADVGLSNVPNVATNDQTPTYTTATTLAALSSGEKLSVAFSKIAKAIVDLGSHLTNKSNPHGVTKTQVELGNVPNVATNDQTPTYTQATTLENITSGEKLTTSMGKIMKGLADLISHIGNKNNPHSVTKTQVGLGNVPNVATNDQTPTYTQATTLTNLTSGEKVSISFGKIMKAIADLISHIGNKSNPHGVTAANINAIPVGFSANSTSTNEDDLDAILSTAINAMPDNSTRIIRVNFSMQHEHFVTGVSATIVVHRLASVYGTAVAITCSPYPEILVKGFSDGVWGTWRNTTNASTLATTAEVIEE